MRLIGLDRVGPDLLTAVCFFAAMAFLVRLYRRPSLGGAVGLGFALGLGCLAKAIMFPTTAICLLTALAMVRPWRHHWFRSVIAGVVAAAVVTPYVLRLSQEQGHFSWGEAGRVAYAIYVTGDDPAHLGRNGDGRRPFDLPHDPGLHAPQLLPTQVLCEDPLIHEFDGPVEGSYPLWRDPSYWYRDMVAAFYWPGQARAINRSLYELLRMLDRGWAWPVLLAMLIGAAGLGKERWRGLLLAPALAQVVMLGLVLVVPRYLAGPLGAMAAVLASPAVPRRPSLMKILVLLTWAGVAVSTVQPLRQAWPDIRWLSDTSGSSHWRTAQAMREAGLRPGDVVGHIGGACKSWSYWASLAEVQIVAELRPADAFWSATAQQQGEWTDVFRRQTRVRALVARPPAGTPLPAGWREIAGTGFRLLMIEDEPAYRSSAPE